MRGLAKLFDVVPDWMWALLLAGAVGRGCIVDGKLAVQRVATANAKAQLSRERASWATTKQQAAEAAAKSGEAAREAERLAALKKQRIDDESYRAHQAAVGRAADAERRLRDIATQYAADASAGGEHCATPAAAERGDDAPAAARLSDETRRDLVAFALEATDAAIALGSCQRYVSEVTGAWQR